MLHLFARIVSIVLHPLLMTTYLFVLLMYFLPSILLPINPANYLVFLGFIFCFTFLLPALSIGVFRLSGSIKSVELPEQRERTIPFLFISVYYALAWYLFYIKVPINPVFIKLLLVTVILVVTATMLNFIVKLSIHSMAIWGTVGMLFWLNRAEANNPLLYPIIIIVILAGFVMSSRVYLNAHSMQETSVGAFTGFLVSFISMLILFK